MKYVIKNYVKLLCFHVNHFQSEIVDEINTDDEIEIYNFIYKYHDKKEYKIIAILMNDMNVISLDQYKYIWKCIHPFYHIKGSVNNTHITNMINNYIKSFFHTYINKEKNL